MKASFLALSAMFALLTFSPSAARAATIYGALGNFDCINDTGQTAHGFEIELDGVAPANVVSTFGAPYNRYGTPTIMVVGGNTFVRYESAYSSGAWAMGTVSGTYAPTGGHSLFYQQYGGTPGYPGTIPGDHFGVGLTATPTNTVYHWLLDGGSGNLVLAGTNVMVPAPVLSLVPPANPVNPVAVQVAVPAPPNENPDPVNHPFGDAIWEKIFITTVENPDPVELNQLVLGNAVVPPETETEIEWQLLQAGKIDGRDDNADVAAGHESVTRRYEFYKYKGDLSDPTLFSAEGEALIENPTTAEALAANNGTGVIGDFLGNQNVALNLAPVVPEPSTLMLGGLGGIGAWFVAQRRRRKK